MISLPPLQLLTLCLLAATLLGAGIGASLWHLRSARRLERALRTSASEREVLDARLVRERESAKSKLAEARAVVSRARGQIERLRLRHDALVAHSREQDRRIDAFEAEILVHEQECRLKRRHDPADSRTSRRQPAARRPEPDVLRAGSGRDEDLPVLSRRVGSRPASGSGSPTGGEPDVRTLTESEPPREADERALELLDTNDSAGRDD